MRPEIRFVSNSLGFAYLHVAHADFTHPSNSYGGAEIYYSGANLNMISRNGRGFHHQSI